MTGVAFELEAQGIEAVEGYLTGLSLHGIEELAFNIGALLESTTKRRIAEEKRAPDGAAWVPWSEAYDETREAHHSLLVGEGNLLDSIQNASTGTTVRVGSNLVYAAIHQAGGEPVGKNIPARPYLGLSSEDEAEITALVTGEWEDMLP